MVTLTIFLLAGLGSGGLLIRYIVRNITTVTTGFQSTVLELQKRHETNETSRAEIAHQLVTDSHKFHEKLIEGTHKVIVDNSVQLALNTNALGKVMERLK